MPENRVRALEAKAFDIDQRGRRRGWVHAHGPTLVELFRVSDAVCLVGSLWLAGRILGVPWNREQFLVAMLAVVCFMAAAAHWPLYRSWRASTLRAELFRAFVCCLTVMLMVMAVLFASGIWPQKSNELLLLWGATAFAAVGGGRVAIRLSLRALRAQGRNFRTAAILGATDIGRQVADQLKNHSGMGIRVIGIFDDRRRFRGAAAGALEIAGDFEALKRHIARDEIDIVYIALPLRAQRLIQEAVRQLRDSAVSVLFVADFSVYGLLHARWEMLGGMPTVSLIDTPHQGLDGMHKRVLDIVVASTALVLLALPLFVIALAIKLTSPGPAIFTQKRYGLDGKEFAIYKFRTMTVVEDGKSQFTQARKDDPRISPLGMFLRRTSLDELPQLLNVLQGHMSLVGPRPHPVALNESQRKLIDGYMLRHKVRPGMTGWAQIHGYRGETDTPEKMENRVRYDLEYINDWSLWLDIRILWKTMLMVLRDQNAF